MGSIEKSTRYTKISGDFGEHLILYWLSRSGFEAIRVDHTGIDVIAYHKQKEFRIGIAITARTFSQGSESREVYLFSARSTEELEKKRKLVTDACKAFACEPWIGVCVETEEYGDLYLTSLAHYDKKYRTQNQKSINAWKMGKRWKEKYASDSKVKHIHFEFNRCRWNWGNSKSS